MEQRCNRGAMDDRMLYRVEEWTDKSFGWSALTRLKFIRII